MLLPFNLIYQMSSWTRAIVIRCPSCTRPIPARPVPAGFDLEELLLPGVARSSAATRAFSWRNFFLGGRLFKCGSGTGRKAMRRHAVQRAKWMLERLGHSDGLGAIYPPMMYSVMALDVLGYRQDHPVRVEALRQFNNLMVDDGERFFFQPCFSPVWDTAIARLRARAGGSGAPQPA